eukprot:TRINITY_DN5392_c0_g3_i1.p5 TRINITY_DN5392_c0_g3~~TRINITY_DN5392_c0_g3_i1.p5  ORF type:complete len:106 (-),score=0.17 TRINITY_DN5392_c0_g3_i1:44-361(-)
MGVGKGQHSAPYACDGSSRQGRRGQSNGDEGRGCPLACAPPPAAALPPPRCSARTPAEVGYTPRSDPSRSPRNDPPSRAEAAAGGGAHASGQPLPSSPLLCPLRP